MDVRPNLTIPLLEQSKIQAQVLVPVLRAFRAELGEERANRIAWRALAEWRQSVARATAAGLQGSPREKWTAATTALLPAIGNDVDVEIRKQDDDTLAFDVTGCRFAQFFQALGEPELGFALTC